MLLGHSIAGFNPSYIVNPNSIPWSAIFGFKTSTAPNGLVLLLSLKLVLVANIFVFSGSVITRSVTVGTLLPSVLWHGSWWELLTSEKDSWWELLTSGRIHGGNC
jgi:hypothetical protein